eukprot:m51a1_g12332 hypothetical protein (239) ;mRNA; f:481443-482159
MSSYCSTEQYESLCICPSIHSRDRHPHSVELSSGSPFCLDCAAALLSASSPLPHPRRAAVARGLACVASRHILPEFQKFPQYTRDLLVDSLAACLVSSRDLADAASEAVVRLSAELGPSFVPPLLARCLSLLAGSPCPPAVSRFLGLCLESRTALITDETLAVLPGLCASLVGPVDEMSATDAAFALAMAVRVGGPDAWFSAVPSVTSPNSPRDLAHCVCDVLARTDSPQLQTNVLGT